MRSSPTCQGGDLCQKPDKIGVSAPQLTTRSAATKAQSERSRSPQTEKKKQSRGLGILGNPITPDIVGSRRLPPHDHQCPPQTITRFLADPSHALSRCRRPCPERKRGR